MPVPRVKADPVAAGPHTVAAGVAVVAGVDPAAAEVVREDTNLDLYAT